MARIILLSLILAGSFAPPAPAQTSDLDPRIQKLVSEISEQRLQRLLEKLSGFETRNTMATADAPPRPLVGARQFILDELKNASPRLQVSFDTYQLPKQGLRILRDVELRNVMAVLPGKSPRRIYISAHYDSLARRVAATSSSRSSTNSADASPGSSQPAAQNQPFDWLNADNPAPGANDDGSGTVLAMELARVFAQSGIEFDATLVFIAFAGEEQGLMGARAHAQKAMAEKVVIDAVLNNDMVGNSLGGNGQIDSGSVRVFADGPEDSPSRQLARFIRRWSSRYYPSHEIRLIARHDRFGRGGDHTAFNQSGYPGIRITESNENYARQHTVNDTVEGVDFAYLARNARANAAAAAVLALAPPAPRVERSESREETSTPAAGRQAPANPGPMLSRQPSGYDARLRWEASPGAVGYRIFWRRAWTADWEHELAVGNVTEFTLPNVSIDDYVFGVAAISAGGHESLVAAYVNPPRREEKVITR